MFETVGHDVVALMRLRFGPISLGELEPGKCRDATSREVAALESVARAAALDGADQ
jgi:16S rRNA U516 pseudouridylate synthase RsuA-like enzyme